ncbi:conserved hypothetical protein [Theileria orientalis strain Shintoku]|uniref:Uncharacterized protein n=1 Tax=Theileria orientalis strain Shintoku TaxID=869250 RepID=J4D5H6_THEOR|nr:conserved hypothetical protein [Theileria orientalis strain Shintoku]BAM38970.1 conserved hypothetical protein [Theileria orientalis strain Shintoku]|eukprot:XP_009689271.1 conserved hypothetical protein [Theileria orientalis strain Shintoku]
MDLKFKFDECAFLSSIAPKISNFLQLESQLLKHLTLDTQFGSGAPTLNSAKLDKLTQLSGDMFADISKVSNTLHEVANEINPSYTRLTPFYFNDRSSFKDLDSFPYTSPLELQVSRQLLRLQSEFFNG